MPSEKFAFRHHLIDTELPPGAYGQTAAVDLDACGRPEFITGQRGGTIFFYRYHSPDRWTRHVIGEDSPSDVGACVVDVEGDGRPDLVTGGAWYRNPGDSGTPFERFVFDPELQAVHDVVAGDINGDGRPEIVTMSDQNDLRWYLIPDDPSRPWPCTRIGPPVHAGASLGDVDGDGALDVVRTDVWFRNVRGDGSEWEAVGIGPSTPPPDDFKKPFTFNATESVVCDMNGNGLSDIVFVDAEIPGGKIWWMENLDGDGRRWQRHEVPNADPVRRGAYHSLQVLDLDGDGDLDIFTCEMEAVGGEAEPRWYIWENLDGSGGAWQEHVILDANLGGHEVVVADFTGNGRPDLIGKPWRAQEGNAVGGRTFVVFLENVSEPRG
ncbi:MAG: FG-GAP repeat domain-containing protein [Armatimonadota bacterium]|jgi:hypothetical protein